MSLKKKIQFIAMSQNMNQFEISMKFRIGRHVVQVSQENEYLCQEYFAYKKKTSGPLKLVRKIKSNQ